MQIQGSQGNFDDFIRDFESQIYYQYQFSSTFYTLENLLLKNEITEGKIHYRLKIKSTIGY